MKNHAQTGLSRLMAVSLIVTVLFSSSMLVLASPGSGPLAAEIIVSGTTNNSEKALVLLNGEQAISGRTFHSSGVVVTSELGSAVINLGKLGRISVSPGSTLSLNFTENNISGDLSAGHINVFNNEGVSVNIHTPDNEVTNDAAQRNSFSVDVRSGMTLANTESGTAFLNNAGVKVPVQNKDDDDNKDAWIPVAVFAGAVGTAIILVMISNGDEDVVSPVR